MGWLVEFLGIPFVFTKHYRGGSYWYSAVQRNMSVYPKLWQHQVKDGWRILSPPRLAMSDVRFSNIGIPIPGPAHPPTVTDRDSIKPQTPAYKVLLNLVDDQTRLSRHG
jgi:hypothetical protein